MSSPRLSVVMPTHNALPFVDESIQSILRQTLDDFEFIILDDASSDGTANALQSWASKDRRIRIISSEQKLGLTGSSNMVVNAAATSIIARMDADDVSHPARLETQFKILASQPEVAAVGCLFEGIDASGQTVRPRDRWRLLRRSPFIPFPHGSAMFRRSAFEAINGYRELDGGEDQDFFFKMTDVGRVVTLPDVLYRFRYHSGNTTFAISQAGIKAVTDRNGRNGANLASLYMLGAMRLWAGQPVSILPHVMAKHTLKFNVRSLMVLGSAALGAASPGLLKFSLRSLIRSRDFLAGLRVKDGRAYEWRLK